MLSLSYGGWGYYGSPCGATLEIQGRGFCLAEAQNIGGSYFSGPEGTWKRLERLKGARLRRQMRRHPEVRYFWFPVNS